jgi:hypothetical protein
MNADIKLIHAANRTVNGPKLLKDRNVLQVDYDYEFDNGTIEWSKIVFTEVILFEWRDNPCCRPDDIVEWSGVRCVGDSDFLNTLKERWKKLVGHTDWDQNKGSENRFKHYTVYFDDVGSLNIIASGCSVES